MPHSAGESDIRGICYVAVNCCIVISKFSRIQGVFKKRPNSSYKEFILQHFKHCPLQSSPLYWQYTVPNVSSIVVMLPGTHFL
jgi:hypothetical protein